MNLAKDLIGTLWKELFLPPSMKVFLSSEICIHPAKANLPDLKPFFPENDQYFSFMDTDNPESIKKAMSALQDYVDLEGPFDFITSISSQSSLTSSLLLRNAVENPEDEPLFKGAIFFSGISPFDFSAIAEGEVRSLEKSTQKLLISIPTVNIWGRNDKKHAEHAAILNSFCTPEMNETLIHNNGSSIPGAGSEQDMIRAAQMIKRVVARTILTS